MEFTSTTRRLVALFAACAVAIVGCSGRSVDAAKRELDVTRRNAEQGDAAAQATLGAAYSCGSRVPRDEVEAASWYRRAAEQGLPLAQRMLGMRYSSGRGVPRDEGLAALWLEKAAHQGDVPAMNLFSDVYARRHEFGTETEWIKKAAATGDALATYRLSDAYFRGDRWRVGVEQNNAVAYKLLVIAAARFSIEKLRSLTTIRAVESC